MTLEIECSIVIAILPNLMTFHWLLSSKMMQSLGQSFFSKDMNISLSLSDHMIYAPAIYHPTSFTGGVFLQIN
jgi:hypothetical protein